MADSNITKRALAQALKELMMTQPLDKISVSNICEQCGLNRKSFLLSFQRQIRIGQLDLLYGIYGNCTEKTIQRFLGIHG